MSSIEKKGVILATPPTSSHRTAEENLGIGYLASNLRANNFQVRIVDGWLEGLNLNETIDRILQLPPPLFLGFSAYRSNIDTLQTSIEQLNSGGFNSPIITGGYGPTFYPRDFLEKGFDIVFRGECEDSIVKYSNYLNSGVPALAEIPGIAYMEGENLVLTQVRKNQLELDSLPFPARDTTNLVLARKTPVHLSTSRGCFANCTYCSIASFQKVEGGAQWRQRTIPNIISELTDLKNIGVNFIKVVDDSFIEPPRNEDWCEELADNIQDNDLNFFMRGSIRADRVTEKVMRELKRAGFFGFSCGIENFSHAALKRMGKRASLEQNLEVLDLFKKYDLIMQQGMIIFDPATTVDELIDNYQGMRTHDHTVIKGIFTEMYAAEGTPFTKLLEKKGLKNPNNETLGNFHYPIQNPTVGRIYQALKMWHKNHSFIYDKTIDPISSPKSLTPEEMKEFLIQARRIRHKDLDFMEKLLDLANIELSNDEILEFTDQEVQSTHSWYSSFEKEVDALYNRLGINYNADSNPFIS